MAFHRAMVHDELVYDRTITGADNIFRTIIGSRRVRDPSAPVSRNRSDPATMAIVIVTLNLRTMRCDNLRHLANWIPGYPCAPDNRGHTKENAASPVVGKIEHMRRIGGAAESKATSSISRERDVATHG